MKDSDIYVFLGPTAFGIDLGKFHPEQYSILPPVRRGDVDELIGNHAQPATIAIVDGTFHSYPSVGHAEIRNALERGWSVWGLSSMGAIRAAEMSQLGMQGFGTVYQRYQSDMDFHDDEVALLHSAEAPYRPLSEPMIHIRYFLSTLTARDLISETAAAEIVDLLKQRWYANRTLRQVEFALLKLGGLSEDEAKTSLASFGQFRLKTIDLVDFLKEKPWRGDQP